MKKNLLLASFLLACHFARAGTEVHVNWPQDALGTYAIPGAMPKPSNQSGTYQLEDMKRVWFGGTGFNTAGYNFSIEPNNGVVTFPFGLSKERLGVRFDSATNTFSFVTVPMELEVKNYDFKADIDGLPANATSGTSADEKSGVQKYKVVYGYHTITYAGTRLPFAIDAKGAITLLTEIKGISVHGSTIIMDGLPLTIVCESSPWSILRWNKGTVSGSNIFCCLPSDTAYTFQTVGKQKTAIPFFVNNEGLLSLDKDGPYAEVIALTTADGAQLGKIMVPDGEAKYQARLNQNKIEKQTADKALAATDTLKWKIDLKLKEKMDLFDFPEEQLSYPVEIPANIEPASLKLLAFADDTVRSIPFQLSNSEKKDGTMHATLSFRADLPRRGSRLFRLVSGFDTTGLKSVESVPPVLKPGSNPHEAILKNGLLVVKVPAGHFDFPGGKPLSEVPPPIIAMARTATPESWMATGSFDAPAPVLVESIDAKLAVSGPLFVVYEVHYKLKDGKDYATTLELRANESHMAIGESSHGFSRMTQTFLRLDYGKGLLDPDKRFVGGNTGYDLFSGAYDRDVKQNALNVCLGLFTPNGNGVMRSLTFYKENGPDAMVVTMNHIRDWQSEKRQLYSCFGAFDNIRFYSKDGAKYLTAGIGGAARFWVVGLIPREEVKLFSLPGVKALPVGPEVRLFNQLTMWSLNGYKDRDVVWDEKLDAAPFDAKGFLDFQYNTPWTPMTYEAFKKRYLIEGSTYFRDVLTYCSNFGGYSDRAVPAYFAEYALNRASWTPEQREQVRMILLTLADYVESDDNQPHHSMMSGHPNFVMDTKQAIPYAVAAFPTYPKAKAWRDSYMEFYNDWLDKYSRKDVPELNTRGGRWTENIACYMGQCFVGLTPDQELLKFYDKTALAKNPMIITLIRWMRDSFMSPHDGVRMLPPEGAHSHAFNPGGTAWHCLFKFCEDMASEAPQLSQEMRWIETNGKEGTNPKIQSALFTDYGPVFHYDFGGPHESYAHMLVLNGMNYRWTGAGIVYYGAKGKVWSYNTMETTSGGSDFKWDEISAFNVGGQGLAMGPTDQLLYDFDFAQFYRQPGEHAYRARAIMLVGDDYLVLSDEVKSPETVGTFNWVSIYDSPQIYQLKPGAPLETRVSRDPQPPRPGAPDRIGKVQSYKGKGDFLTIVAPAAVKAEAKPFGAIVNGDYVFASQAPVTVKESTVGFSGTYGFARQNQLALFQGTQISLGGFELRREGGDFGLSASAEKGRISGRIVGRSGGQILITPPAGFAAARAIVKINGQTVPHTTKQNAIVFPVEIAQKDGLKTYEITF